MKRKYFSVLVGLAMISAARSFAADADFTVTDDVSNPGAYYANFNEADAGVSDVFTIGFQIDITQLNGVASSFANPFATFCVELEEPISLSSYTSDFVSLSGVARGRAGESGTASSAMPLGGIGDLAAARAQALFDNHYLSSILSDWTHSETSPNAQAFQLALWEVTHDSDLSMTDTNGAIYVGAQSGTTQINGLSLAQTWLNELSGVTTSYSATTWDVWALEDIGTPGDQDVLFATAIGSQDSSTIGAAVPEPTSALLVLVGGIAIGFRRRRA